MCLLQQFLIKSIVVGQGANGDSVINYNIIIAPEKNRVDTFATSCDDFVWDRTSQTTYTSSTIDSVGFLHMRISMVV